MGKRPDLVGQTFNDWLVLELSNNTRKSQPKQKLWKTQCKCGVTSYNCTRDLRLGNSKRCKSCAAKEQVNKGKYTLSFDYVYFIQSDEFIKIGATSNVNKRLETMQVGNPYKLNLITVVDFTKYSEEFFHGLFADKHYRGEWYKMTKEECESRLSRLD
jgi:hypothetical protein